MIDCCSWLQSIKRFVSQLNPSSLKINFSQQVLYINLRDTLKQAAKLKMPKAITASHRHIILDQNQNDICVEGLGCHMHVQHANANKCAKNVAATTLNNQRKKQRPWIWTSRTVWSDNQSWSYSSEPPLNRLMHRYTSNHSSKYEHMHKTVCMLLS